jgi:hypothetical protein
VKRNTADTIVIIAAFVAVIVVTMVAAGAGETPIYGPDGKYQ